MPLHDQIVNTNQRPAAEPKQSWSYDSSTMGDMHAHAEGLLWRTELEGIITTSDISDDVYAELAHISEKYYCYTEQIEKSKTLEHIERYSTNKDYNDSLKHAKLRFDKILSKVKLAQDLPDNYLLHLIGDTLSDRGPSDELMFKVFKKLQALAIEQLKERAKTNAELKKKLKEQTLRFFRINLSNHDTSFLKWYLKYQNTGDASFSSNISSQQTTSLKNLCFQVEQGLITRQELTQWVEEDYIPHLELFSFSQGYNKKGEEECIIRTHAPSPESMYDTIEKMGLHLKVVAPGDNSKNYDKEYIDAINQTFRNNLKKRDPAKKMVGLQNYIDDYEYQEWIGNIQTIAHIIDDIRSDREDVNMALLFKAASEIQIIENNAKDYNPAVSEKIENLHSSEKYFLKAFREKFNNFYIQPYLEAQKLTQAQDTKKKGEETMKTLESDLLFILTPLSSDNKRSPSSNDDGPPLEIDAVLNRNTQFPCPYYWITNNRWIPQDPLNDTLAGGTTVSRRYGHVGENKDDPCNLDTKFFQGNQNGKKTEDKQERFYRSDRLCTLEQHRQYCKDLIKQIEEIDRNKLLSVNLDLRASCDAALVEKKRIAELLTSPTIAPDIILLEKQVHYLTQEIFTRSPKKDTSTIPLIQPAPYQLTTLITPNEKYLKKCTELHNILQNTVSKFLEKEAKLNNSKKFFGKKPGQSKKREVLNTISDNLWRKEIQLRKHIAEVNAAIKPSTHNMQTGDSTEAVSLYPLDLKKMAEESVQLLDENKTFLQKNKYLFDVPRKALCWFLSHALCVFSEKNPSQQKYNSYAVLFHKAGETHANLIRQEAKKALNNVKTWKGLPGLLNNVGEKGKQSKQNQKVVLNDSTVKQV